MDDAEISATIPVIAAINRLPGMTNPQPKGRGLQMRGPNVAAVT